MRQISKVISISDYLADIPKLDKSKPFGRETLDARHDELQVLKTKGNLISYCRYRY